MGVGQPPHPPSLPRTKGRKWGKEVLGKLAGFKTHNCCITHFMIRTMSRSGNAL